MKISLKTQDIIEITFNYESQAILLKSHLDDKLSKKFGNVSEKIRKDLKLIFFYMMVEEL